MASGGVENFRDLQYYQLLKEMYGRQHKASATAYASYCSCKECAHTFRGDCLKDRCECCTSQAAALGVKS